SNQLSYPAACSATKLPSSGGGMKPGAVAVKDSGNSGCRSRRALVRGCAVLTREAHQREHAEGRHGASLQEAHIAVLVGPVGNPLERKFRRPAELARMLREPALEARAQSALRADVVHEHDLAAGLQDAREFVERLFRL